MFEHLVAITPDGPLTAQWFGADIAAATAWAHAQNQAGANLYFTVNEVRPGLSTKPSKTDIARVRFAHVDIDPPKDGPWDKDAALAALMSQNPSVIIDSGNGWQGLWRLNATVLPEQVEAINRGIAHVLGADSRVWNVDRLFRFPGTINWPTAAKRAAGRVPTRSDLILDDPGLWYAPTALAAHYPAPARVTQEVAEVELGEWDIFDPPIPSPEVQQMLWADVPPGSRSEHAAKLAHQMGREGYSLEEIMGTLMNPAWPWSGTIHDQQDPERQAKRKLMGVKVAPKGEEMFPAVPSQPRNVIHPTKEKAIKGGYGSRDGGSFLGITQQFEHFAGCIYVESSDRVLMPNGSELNQSRFDVIRGGHIFAMDDVNEKSTKSAWEAFLKNSAYAPPTVQTTCFRPELEPFEIITDGIWRLVNTYQPINTPRKQGDVSRFLKHMKHLFPDDRDREILITYMASLVQNPGVKFQWWPVIQGAKGNGKTLLLSVMQYCIGDQYSHLPNTAKMTRNGISFNGWLRGKLFLGLDEVYSGQRREFLEEFKPYVTNKRLPIESKGVDEYTGDNRANGMMLTNHRDGVPQDKDERRYAVFFTKQQTAEDCLADGLTPAYFSDLWGWLEAEGFAVINEFLHTYQCDPSVDPLHISRAPRTTSTEAAIEAGRGRAEMEILDAVEADRPGFRGGYVSSRMVARLMEEKRIPLPRNKYRDVMDALGYRTHPGLLEGKTPNVVMPDSARTVLYVLKGSTWPETANKGEIGDDYSSKQMGGP